MVMVPNFQLLIKTEMLKYIVIVLALKQSDNVIYPAYRCLKSIAVGITFISRMNFMPS